MRRARSASNEASPSTTSLAGKVLLRMAFGEHRDQLRADAGRLARRDGNGRMRPHRAVTAAAR